MKISVLAVGRLKSGAEQTLFNRYFDLFNAAARNLRLAPIALVEIGEGRGESPAERKEAEANELLVRLPPGTRLVLLEEQGKLLTSVEFTTMISKLRDEALDVAFALGGPDGHGEPLRKACSFSAVAWPDDLAAWARPHSARRAALPGDDDHAGPPLPPGLVILSSVMAGRQTRPSKKCLRWRKSNLHVKKAWMAVSSTAMTSFSVASCMAKNSIKRRRER